MTDASGSREFRWRRSLQVSAALCLLLFAADAVSAQAVRGRVIDAERSVPVAGVTIQLVNARQQVAKVTTSDSLGRFSLEAETGQYTLRAGRFGYEVRASAPFTLTAGQPLERELQLTPRPFTLAPVELTARRSGLEAGRQAFLRRCNAGSGFCFTQDFIRDMRLLQTSDVFAAVPGLWLDFDGSMRPRVHSMLANRCLAVMHNHNLRPLQFTGVKGKNTDQYHMDVISPDEVRGVEVYRTYSELPQDLRQGLYVDQAWPSEHLGGCGIAFIWTDEAW